MNPTKCQGSPSSSSTATTTVTASSSVSDGGDCDINNTKISVDVAANNAIGDDGWTAKTVTFGVIADEIWLVIPQSSELTEKEISELWYTSSDLEKTKREIIETLSILRPCSSFSKTTASKHKKLEICSRGLEMQTDRVRKFDAIRAVNAMFEEQKRQKLLGINDPDQLAKVYRAKAVFAEETALKMGRQDEEEAELALAELDKPNNNKNNNGSPTLSMFKNIKGRLRSLSPKRSRSSPMQSPKSVVLKLSSKDVFGQQQQRHRPSKQKGGRTLTPLRQRSMQKEGSTRSIKDVLSISGHRSKETKMIMGRTSMDTV